MSLYKLLNWFGLLGHPEGVMNPKGTVFGGPAGDGVQNKPVFYSFPKELEPPKPPGGPYRDVAHLVKKWEREAY